MSVADLETITVKRIRNALQELFAIELLPHKVCTRFPFDFNANTQKEMNDFILERYYKLLDARKNPKQPTKEEIERQDEIMARELLRSEMRGPVTRRGGPTKVVKKKKTRKTGAVPNSPFNAEQVLSELLQAVVGSPRLSRPQAVKHIWAYIKSHGLQDPSNKRNIICDDKLQAVFKKLVVDMFEMNKILSKHLYKDDDIVKPENGKREESDSVSSAPSQRSTPVKREDDDLSEISDVDD